MLCTENEKLKYRRCQSKGVAGNGELDDNEDIRGTAPKTNGKAPHQPL
jgi:hypothetical protein